MAAALWNDKCHMYLMLSRIEIVIFLVHFWLFLSFPRFQSKWKYFPSYLLQKWTNVYDFCDVIMISALATIKNIRSVFEIRKNTWLYHGQPYYNLWLSVQISGCPYLEYTLTKVSFGYRFIGLWLSVGQLHQYFRLSGDFFWLSRAHGQQNFRTLHLVDVQKYYSEIGFHFKLFQNPL